METKYGVIEEEGHLLPEDFIVKMKGGLMSNLHRPHWKGANDPKIGMRVKLTVTHNPNAEDIPVWEEA